MSSEKTIDELISASSLGDRSEPSDEELSIAIEELKKIDPPKHYCYGSGMIGCLYDNGPNFCEEKEDAIESLVVDFQDSLSEEETEQMKENLRREGIHYFAKPSEVGAHYCDVTEYDGPCPMDEDYG